MRRTDHAMQGRSGEQSYTSALALDPQVRPDALGLPDPHLAAAEGDRVEEWPGFLGAGADDGDDFGDVLN